MVPLPLDNQYKYNKISRPLDTNICLTGADALEVAAEACRRPNKYPFTVNHDNFQLTSRSGRNTAALACKHYGSFAKYLEYPKIVDSA
jgi:hypothetical protein